MIRTGDRMSGVGNYRIPNRQDKSTQPMIPTRILSLSASLFLLGANHAIAQSVPKLPPAARPAVFVPRDAGLIDVTKPPYNAKGDGITDDTEAIRSATSKNLEANRSIFFPAGTYLVSEPIEWKNTSGVYYSHTSWRGEGVGKTVIRLKDNSPAFQDAAKPQPLIRTGSNGKKGDGGGDAAHDLYLQDFTVEIGAGNPGIIAIDYLASNGGCMERVDVIAKGAGGTGVRLARDYGPALVREVRVAGFSVGLQTGGGFGSTIENVLVIGQEKYGFVIGGNATGARHLTSNNRVPAVRTGPYWSLLSAVDCSFTGGAPDQPAIDANETALFLRDVTTTGYGVSLRGKKEEVKATKFTEYVSGRGTPVQTLFEGTPTTSLRLPIEETPDYLDENPAHWANVVTFGADPAAADNSEAFQKAVDSGKPIVYVPIGKYKFTKSVILRGTLRKLVGFGVNLVGATFHCENAQAPVVIERLLGMKIINAATKPVVVRHTIGPISAEPGPRTWFLENVVSGGIVVGKGQKMWARHLNCESSKETQLTNDGGTVWILGFKTEYDPINLKTVNGGRSEIIGGCVKPAQGVKDRTSPAFVVEDSWFSASYLEVAFTAKTSYDVYVRETRGGVTKEQVDKGQGYWCPLFVAGPGK